MSINAQFSLSVSDQSYHWTFAVFTEFCYHMGIAQLSRSAVRSEPNESRTQMGNLPMTLFGRAQQSPNSQTH